MKKLSYVVYPRQVFQAWQEKLRKKLGKILGSFENAAPGLTLQLIIVHIMQLCPEKETCDVDKFRCAVMTVRG